MLMVCMIVEASAHRGWGCCECLSLACLALVDSLAALMSRVA
jgi:hypothetical protein